MFFSDSLFDSPLEPAFLITNITEWRKDIPTPLASLPDLSFSSDFQDMQASDFFDFKDTASECSMDSAYQSQSGASRGGVRKSEGQPQTARIQMTHQYSGSDLFSPSLTTDGYNTFSDQSLDMSQLQQSPANGPWDTTDGTAVFANFSAGQDFSQYSTTNVPQYSQASGLQSQWSTNDAQVQSNPYTFASFPVAQSSQDLSYNVPTAPQRQWSSNFDMSDRPRAARSSSSYTIQEEGQRGPAQDATFGGLVGTPTSTTSIHFPTNIDFDQSKLYNLRNENDDSKSSSYPTQSLDGDDDILSQSDSTETKLEEERTKVARSHPLYQQEPDKDGKYHCPEEGNPGCNHKPTALKCNYDKFVDSHLKPFRCNKKTCVGVQFSSTACLLRHEREAHGMHGHGARPHLCHFPDCERAAPGHGFPRRYNLFDHMKRVHQYDGPTTDPSPTLPGPTSQRKPISRKRKTSSDDVVEKRSKVAKLTIEQQRQQRRTALTQEFLGKKQRIIEMLTSLGGPNDLKDDNQLNMEVLGLHDICTKYREVFGG